MTREDYTTNPDQTNGGLWAQLPKEPILAERKTVHVSIAVFSLLAAGVSILMAIGAYTIISVAIGLVEGKI